MTQRAVIMAGGQGKRLAPLTAACPKPLVPVANRPVIDYILELLKEHEFTDVTLTLHYRAEDIITHVGDGERYGLCVDHVVEHEPLGTAGSVKQALGQISESTLVISGDCLTDFDLAGLLRHHRRTEAAVSLALTRVDNPVEYGVVITDKEGRIQRFLEKPSWQEVFSDTINTGIYLLEPEAIEAIPPGICDFSRDLFPRLLEQGAVLSGQVMTGYWCDIGDVSQYRQAQQAALSGRVRVRCAGQQVRPGVWVQEGARIEGELVPPVAVGRNAVVKQGAVVGGGSCLGDGVHIGTGSRIMGSVLWQQVKVETEVEANQSVLCDRAVVQPRSVLCPGSVLGHAVCCGTGSRVGPDIKVWPRQEIEAGWRLERHLRQPVRWPEPLLYRSRAEGVFNREFLVEDACRLGRALAQMEGPVVMADDGTAEASTIASALMAGTRAGGGKVVNLGTTWPEVTRFAVRSLWGRVAAHVMKVGTSLRLLLYDEVGEELTGAKQRKFEGAWDREGTSANACGPCIDADVTPSYTSWLVGRLPQSLREADMDLRMDAAGSRRLGECLRHALKQARGAPALCLRLGPHGVRQLDFARGPTVTQEQINALAVHLYLGEGHKQMVVPVRWASTVGGVVERAGSRILVAQPGDEISKTLMSLGGEPFGQNIFWQDDVLRLLYCISHLGTQWDSWHALLMSLPRTACSRRMLTVPQQETGRVMRALARLYDEKELALTDGIQISASTGWVWGRPDGHLPLYHIEASSFSREAADELAQGVEDTIKAILSDKAQA